MTPIDLDDDDTGDWVIEVRGRTSMPPRRTALAPHAQAQRSIDVLAQPDPAPPEARRLGPLSGTPRTARHLSQHDLGRVFNDSGAVICAVQLTERARAGTVDSYESSAVYEPVGEPGDSPDRGGCMDLLTPSRMMIRKSHALAANSCLVQIEAWQEGGA
jgi:Pyrogallol hydroxytransferase large subunit-like, domain 1